MMDAAQLEQYRRMTPAERWAMSWELARFAWDLWERNLTPQEIDRRLAIRRQEEERSNENLLRGLRDSK